VSIQQPASPRRGSGARRAAEQRSALPLLYLRQLPRWVLPVVLAALMVTGLAVRGWGGAVALCVPAALLSWLAFLSWPALTGRGRLGRAVAIAALLGLAALQATR
jgi:O-antigen ligase